MRRKRVLIAAGLLLFGAGSWFGFLWHSAHLPESKLMRLRLGMSAAEVEAVFGRPADEVISSNFPREGEGPVARQWHEREGVIDVCFDENDKVKDAAKVSDACDGPTLTNGLSRPTLFGRMRRWLGW